MLKRVSVGCSLLLAALALAQPPPAVSGKTAPTGKPAQAKAPKLQDEKKKTGPAPATLKGHPVGPAVTPPGQRGTQQLSPAASSRPSYGSTGHANSGRITAAGFLTSPESEISGFGLYSYILFGARASSASDRWRLYYATITAFLAIPAFYDELRFVPPGRMNITLLPVSTSREQLPSVSKPFFQLDQSRLSICPGDVPLQQAACVLVDDYDYARAAAILSLFDGPHMGGPYIISATQPLSRARTLPIQYLYQDLSSVPPQLVPLWINLFMVQARDEQFWKTRSKDEFILRLRTTLAVVSAQLPDLSASIGWHLPTFTQTVQAASPQESKPPVAINVGDTINQVVTEMGQPDHKATVGNKSIYFYKNMKVVFVDGKVSDVE